MVEFSLIKHCRWHLFLCALYYSNCYLLLLSLYSMVMWRLLTVHSFTQHLHSCCMSCVCMCNSACDKYAYVHPYGKAFGNNAGAFHSVLLCDPFCVALVDENNERWNTVLMVNPHYTLNPIILTAPHVAHKRLLLQVYLGYNTLEFSGVSR